MKMRITALFLVAFSLIVGVASLSACEIEVKATGEEKTAYAKDEIVILEVTVTLTHRNCPKGIDATQFQGDGMKLLGAKKWEKVSRQKYSRLVKVQMTGNEQGEAVLHALRTCNKEGGHGIFKVKVQ